MESKFTREDFVFLANMSLNSQRFEEMVNYVKKFSEKVTEF